MVLGGGCVDSAARPDGEILVASLEFQPHWNFHTPVVCLGQGNREVDAMAPRERRKARLCPEEPQGLRIHLPHDLRAVAADAAPPLRVVGVPNVALVLAPELLTKVSHQVPPDVRGAGTL